MGKRLVLAVLCVGFLGMGSSAQAAEITVDTTVDSFNVPGECSLRSAVYAADKNVATGGCPAGTVGEPDEVKLPAGTYVLTLAGAGEDDGKTGDLDISNPGGIRIGPVDRRQNVTIDGAGSDRLIDLSGGPNGPLAEQSTYLRDLTLSNGQAVGTLPGNGGGAIRVFRAQIYMTRVLMVGNRSESDGGAIAGYEGDLLLNNSTASGNTANGSGGGAFMKSADLNGQSLLYNVTISNNRADFDADGNGEGGGIATGDSGASNFRLPYSIVADNFDDSAPPGIQAPDCYAVSPTGITSNISILTQELGTPICGSLTAQAPIDPQLQPLADNGGPSLTHALAPTSPAADAASIEGVPFSACQIVDQRGAFRRVGLDECNLGAFQLDTAFPGILRPTAKLALYTGGVNFRLGCPARFKPKCEITAVAVTKKKNGKAMSKRTKLTLASGESAGPFGASLEIKPRFAERVNRKTYTRGDRLTVKITIKSKRVNGRKALRPKTIYRSYGLRVSAEGAFGPV